jgi:T5SS/PEP-CTERM-associated repeat protein
VVVVTGTGSAWNGYVLDIGYFGSFNTLLITNGGKVSNGPGSIGYEGSNNTVTVTGSGSAWINSATLSVGIYGGGNQLVVSHGAEVSATHVSVGSSSSLFGNRLTVIGGTLRSNVFAHATLNIFHGTNVLDAGRIEVDRLLLTKPAGFFEFNGGTLNARTANVANGAVFIVGNGSSAATYFMSGNPNDNHLTDGLVIANNATLSGNGFISDFVTVAPGATLSPGSSIASIGTIRLQLPPVLQGNIFMEITNILGTLTNDVISIDDVLFLGGSLVVSNLGPDALAAGDSFQLFSTVGPIEGAFESITLPALPAGLSWTNKLLVNGTIEVVTKTAPQISGAPWYRLTSTNVALPLANWTTNGTGVFDWFGNVTITNGINFGEPQRYFRIYAP